MQTKIKVDGEWVDGSPQLNEWHQKKVGSFTNGDPVWTECRFTETSLEDDKLAKIALVNPLAKSRIEDLDWEKERSIEQPELYPLEPVLTKRQGIRDASNKAKIDIDALETKQDVKQFTW